MLQPTHIKHIFPGMGTAAAIMGVYIIGEQIVNLVSPSHHDGHGHGHGHGHDHGHGHGHGKLHYEAESVIPRVSETHH